jgi:2-oxoisovalerate dehydrogenase E1 component
MVGVYEDGVQVEGEREGVTELVVLTYGNGVPMALRVAKKLLAEHGVATRVVDLRWISPLPEAAIRRHAEEARAVLVVDECRRSGNVSEAIAACLADSPALRAKPFARVTSADSFIPLADAANLVLLQEPEIYEAAERLTT